MPNQFDFFHTDTQIGPWITGDGVSQGWVEYNALTPTGWITGDGSQSATFYTDFFPLSPLSTLFSGIYRLFGVYQGRAEDYAYSFTYDSDRFPSIYFVRLGGKVGAIDNLNFTFSGATVSGNVFGTFRPEVEYQPSYTGELSGLAFDPLNLGPIYSGELSGVPPDLATVSGIFSGEFTGLMREEHYAIPTVSGEMVSGLNTIFDVRPTISGALFRKDKDRAYITFGITGITFSVGGHKVVATGGDVAAITFSMETVTYVGHI